jgi:HD-GYP domain-containing protein (c-di-GMP phosphodiesterase class II)
VGALRRAIELSPSLQARLVSPPGDEDYGPVHSVTLAHLACALASALTWTSGQTFFQLCLAAFLHDLPLGKRPIAQLQTLDDLAHLRERFSTEDIQSFLKHPETAAEWTRQMTGLPPDVDRILVEHHERPDGSGFPKRLNQLNIAQLSAVFIFAHELMSFYLKVGPAGRIEDFINGLAPEFHRGVFREIHACLVRTTAQAG